MRIFKLFFLILIINILYVTVLFYHPKSTMYHLNKQSDEVIIETLDKRISDDSNTYIEYTEDGIRTIGYPLIIKAVRIVFPNNWLIFLIFFQCIASAIIYCIIFDFLKNKWAIIPLILLGTYIVYVPYIMTEIFFSLFFILSVYFIKKNIWFHFIFLGIASLIRPSLAWIFIVEPFILFFYGKPKWVIYLSVPLSFIATSYNRFRNLKYNGKFIHSTVLMYNYKSESYFNGSNKFIYPIKAFIGNGLSGHYDFAGNFFKVYKRDFGYRKKSILMWFSNIICVIINSLVWLRFIYLIYAKKINWGNVILVLYIILPTLLGSAGARLRIPIEFLLY